MQLRVLFFNLVFFFLTNVYSQTITQCSGLKRLPIKFSVRTNGIEQKGSISKTLLKQKGFCIEFSDTTVKLVGFIVVYDCSNCDFQEKTYLTKCVEYDNFLRGTEVGYSITFDCINVMKDGKLYEIKGEEYKVNK